MPFRHDVRSVTVPGCVDGWIALHERYGTLPFGDVLAPAIELAEAGSRASASLIGSLRALDDAGAAALSELRDQAFVPGEWVRRPAHGAVLRRIASDGRAGFYEGPFGRGLQELAPGQFTADDLATDGADWVDPLAIDAWGHRIHTMPPNSQGYVTLGAVAIAADVGLPDDITDPQWAHVLVESSILAAHDRPDVLHDGADGPALIDALRRRSSQFDARRATALGRLTAESDTTYVCAVDGHGVGISLIQSNGGGFGSWLVEPSTGINLHNRGTGFSLDPTHPAALSARRRPPHTLAPALVTAASDELVRDRRVGGRRRSAADRAATARPTPPPRSVAERRRRRTAMGVAQRSDRLRHVDQRRRRHRGGGRDHGADIVVQRPERPRAPGSRRTGGRWHLRPRSCDHHVDRWKRRCRSRAPKPLSGRSGLGGEAARH